MHVPLATVSGLVTDDQPPAKEPQEPFVSVAVRRSSTPVEASTPAPEPSFPSEVVIVTDVVDWKPSGYVTEPPVGALTSFVTVNGV